MNGEKMEKRIVIGGDWTVEVDTFVYPDEFPSSYYGNCCDIAIRTNTASIDFIISLRNIKTINTALENYREYCNGYTRNCKYRTFDEKVDISEVVINGVYYSNLDLKIIRRSPQKCYLTFTDREDIDFSDDESDDIRLDYNIVASICDVEDVIKRILTNYSKRGN